MDAATAAALIAAIAGMLTALTGFVYMIARVLKKVRGVQIDQKILWHGMLARGFLEAIEKGFLNYANGKWTIRKRAREVFSEVEEELRRTYSRLVVKADGGLDDDAIGWAIEANPKLQNWMLETVCPSLRLNRLGCVAIAIVIARENGELENAIEPG